MVLVSEEIIWDSPTACERSIYVFCRTRMVVDDGHLVFQAPEDKNISFRTSSGRGGILLNGNDVLEILNSVRIPGNA